MKYILVMMTVVSGMGISQPALNVTTIKGFDTERKCLEAKDKFLKPIYFGAPTIRIECIEVDQYVP